MGNTLMSSLAYRFYMDSKKKEKKRYIKIELPISKNNKVYRWYNFINR